MLLSPLPGTAVASPFAFGHPGSMAQPFFCQLDLGCYPTTGWNQDVSTEQSSGHLSCLLCLFSSLSLAPISPKKTILVGEEERETPSAQAGCPCSEQSRLKIPPLGWGRECPVLAVTHTSASLPPVLWCPLGVSLLDCLDKDDPGF